MKFSVSIPAYKARYLSEAIDSVLAQSYDDFELIIVNDASPENLDVILNRYNDQRIHYFKNGRNCGAENVVDNWNICLSHAQGDYIICMGDDDRLLPNCLSTYSELIEKYPDLDVYHGWTKIIDENGKAYKMQEPRPERESVYSMIWNKWGGRIQFIGDFLFKTSSLREHGGFYFLPLAWASDDITPIIVAGRKGIANTQVPIFEYRENRRTITNTGNAETKFKAILEEKKWYENFLKIIPSDSIDNIYYNSIIHELKHHFRVKIQGLLISDVKMKGLVRWFYWLKKRDVTGLSFLLMVWILVVAINNKRKGEV